MQYNDFSLGYDNELIKYPLFTAPTASTTSTTTTTTSSTSDNQLKTPPTAPVSPEEQSIVTNPLPSLPPTAPIPKEYQPPSEELIARLLAHGDKLAVQEKDSAKDQIPSPDFESSQQSSSLEFSGIFTPPSDQLNISAIIDDSSSSTVTESAGRPRSDSQVFICTIYF